MEPKPCPICNGVNTQIRENTYWTGMRNQLLGVTLIHWCEKQEDQYVTGTVNIRARTAEQAVGFWNGK